MVILSGDAEGEMSPLGSREQLTAELATVNTGPEKPGEDIFYGPGLRLELSPGQDPVTQMLLTIDDEDIGWITLIALAKRFRWKILDPMTGRELNLAGVGA